MTQHVAVIKTGWCDAYDGQDVEGNFGHLKNGGSGAERFNMVAADGGYQVYTMPKGHNAPMPMPSDGWLIYHIARDPAELKMKLVGWYEGASFLGEYKHRGDSDSDVAATGYDGSVYCIVAETACVLLPVDRPVVEHGSRFGSSSIFWLVGNEGYKPKEPWNEITTQLESLRRQLSIVALQPEKVNKASLGDTREKGKVDPNVEFDDGGSALGRNNVAESDEHKALKLWACGHPQKFTHKAKDTTSLVEFPLRSGDRVDVVHRDEESITLIEVKSRRSGEDDIERGVFQCVKYAAVYKAMQKGGARPVTVNAVLLTEKKVSRRLTALAKRLGVTLMRHKVKA